jgi:hypothetical protein
VNITHNVNRLGHPEDHGYAAQRVSVEFADLGLGRSGLPLRAETRLRYPPDTEIINRKKTTS